jgi:hypothetical protein
MGELNQSIITLFTHLKISHERIGCGVRTKYWVGRGEAYICVGDKCGRMDSFKK